MDLRGYYVPTCLVPSRVNFTAGSLMNFAHRQYLLTRVYAPRLYLTALILLTLYPLGLIAAVISLLAGVLMRDITLGIAGCVSLVLVADLWSTLRLERWTTPVWMTLHALLAWRAAFGRVMNWRGIRYRLYAPQRVERLD